VQFRGKADPDAGAQSERYLIAESIMLEHHAAETLIRLYIAHESAPG
jgi:hypothetical protein